MIATRQRLRLSSCIELSVTTAGDPTTPAVLLLHGFPSSAQTFRELIPSVSRSAYVIAPDLPGFGHSDVLPSASFEGFAEAVSELLTVLQVGPRHIYLHDYGAPVGFHIAMREPDRVLGLIIQNANAHRTGFGPQWSETLSFWAQPKAENEAAATAHLTFEGTRAQYIAGVPSEVAAKISPNVWREDWRVMCLPGRMETQRALVADYGRYVARFEAIAAFLSARQPPALLLWGRHDAYFDIAETLSWMQDLPRMEAHVLDAGHHLLETHAPVAAALISEFVARSSSG